MRKHMIRWWQTPEAPAVALHEGDRPVHAAALHVSLDGACCTVRENLQPARSVRRPRGRMAAAGISHSRRNFFRVLVSWVAAAFTPKPAIPAPVSGINDVLTREKFTKFAREAFRYSDTSKTFLASPSVIESIEIWKRGVPVFRESEPQRHRINRVRDAIHAEREMQPLSSRSVAFYGEEWPCSPPPRKKRAQRGRSKHRGKKPGAAHPDGGVSSAPC